VENTVIGGIHFDVSLQLKLKSLHPGTIASFLDTALRTAHDSNAVLSLRILSQSPDKPFEQWLLAENQMTDELISLLSILGITDYRSDVPINKALDITPYKHFAEFFQKETAPVPQISQPGLDYFYCIKPFEFKLISKSDTESINQPLTKGSWAIDFQFLPTEISKTEAQIIPQILTMVKPLTQDRQVQQTSELTGINRTKYIPADTGAVQCYTGFNHLLSQLSGQQIFFSSLKLLTQYPEDIKTLIPWIQIVLLNSSPISIVSGKIDSEPGQEAIHSFAELKASAQTVTEFWNRADAPVVLKRIHRLIPISQAGKLSSNALISLSANEISVPASSETESSGEESVYFGQDKQTQDTDLDESLYHSFYLNRFSKKSSDSSLSNQYSGSDSADSQSSLLPSRYRILSHLGSGGMGDVYLVLDTELGRERAVKILRESISGNPDRIAQFKSEVSLTQDLVHENIVRIHHLDSFNGRYYCVMEHVTGKDLADHLKTLSTGMDMESTRFILMHICQGMIVAHDKGIIHRDLKPGNIMLTSDNKIKILDFGLACLKTKKEAALTGSIGYMAPEILQGQPADERSDIFSVGAIGYKMLTLKQPGGYFGPDLGLGDSIDLKFAAVIIDAMQGEAEHRIQTMEEFSTKLWEV